jgi:hypothetical protein
MIRARTCNYCKTKYTPTQKVQRFCSTKCKDTHHNQSKSKRTAAKVERRKLKLPYTAFWQGLAQQCKRSGTVEILQGHTATSLTTLYKLRKQCTLASGIHYGEVIKKQYELSHICPSSGHHAYIGLYHPDNLIIAPFAFNRKRGTSYTEGGSYILRSALHPKWLIRDKDSVKEIFAKMHKYLGTELDIFLSENALTITQKESLIRKILKRVKSEYVLCGYADDAIELHIQALHNHLKTLDTDGLNTFALQKDLTINIRSITSKSQLTVLFEELTRCQQRDSEHYNGTLTPFLMIVEAMHTKKHCHNNEFDTVQAPIFTTTNRLVRAQLEEAINTAGWQALHCDQFSSQLNGLPFIDHLSLGTVSDDTWRPVLGLEQALLQRDGYPLTHHQHCEQQDEQRAAQKLASTPIWDIEDYSIFPEGTDMFDMSFMCQIPEPQFNGWLEFVECPF